MGLTRKQKTIIHVAASKVGMSEDDRRAMMEAEAGVRSTSDPTFTRSGFLRVMKRFEKCGFKSKGNSTRQKSPERPGMATAKQLSKINVMWNLLEGIWYDSGNNEAALKEFLEKRFQTSHITFLTFEKAHNVIEAIKAIGQREGAAIRD